MTNEEIIEMLNDQIKEILEDIEVARYDKKEVTAPLLEKLKILTAQKVEMEKILEKEKELELEQQKIESDIAAKNEELKLKKEEGEKNRVIEEARNKEQKRNNTIQAVIGGVTAATGVIGLVAASTGLRKILRFEETGSFTDKSTQILGGLFNLFRRR